MYLTCSRLSQNLGHSRYWIILASAPLGVVLVRVTIALIAFIKHHDQKQVWGPGGWKGLFGLYKHHSPLTKEVRAGTWRPELMQIPSRSVAYWLVLHAFLYHLGPPSQGDTTHSEMGSSISIIN